MKISLNWLKDFIALPEDENKISEILTDTGLEVEGLERFEEIEGGLEGLVIGEVLTCDKHPDADKLSITTVDIGTDQPAPIVCGAPNVAVGQKVVVATVGTTLYPGSGEPFKIKKAKIRGQVSEGMICAEDEIGLGESHDGIMVLDTKLKNGTPAKDYFNPETDTVIEIGLTPNRADGASHYGVARDLKAAFRRPISFPELGEFEIDNQSNTVEVEVENYDACPRYSGLTLSNLTIKESPKWLKNRLKSIGLAPINNVVDVTNYVLHGLGQPLHAFDLANIVGNKVIVKTLPDGTKFTTLDEKERILTDKDLMICDGESKGMCIGGVFGGTTSGVKNSTKSIFLESAYFSADWVRNTATRHGIKTDASFRYERGTDPNMTVHALKYAALLIKKLAGGEISSEIIDLYPRPVADFEIEVKFKNVDRLIGKVIPRDRIKEILEDLDINVSQVTDEGFKATVPPYRVDVTREADIVEEVLRIYGYNNIELEENYGTDFLAAFPAPDKDKIQSKTTDFLTALGFNEIISNSLTNPAYVAKTGLWDEALNVEVLNKLSEELGVLRQTMVFSGLESLKYNINRKQSNLKFFEFGRVYTHQDDEYNEQERLAMFITGDQTDESWNVDKKSIDFYSISSTVHKILDKFSLAEFDSLPTTNPVFEYGLDISKDDQWLVSFGKINKKVSKVTEVAQDVFYAEFNWAGMLERYGKKILFKPVPKFPEVRRDLSLVLDEQVNFQHILELAKAESKKLVKRINVFSVYQGDSIGEGKKSYALSFILQDENKTLTDKIIDKTMNGLIARFEKELNAIIRK
ncbi:MAG: phenylalanine--tRNA ligase subunit beta [Reichenbachiella sp.]|uniref:phenylalanine--tRNA ligase subunit beta n=1 Tax=Reichenbachiella sp. TaxID=2184521 RepID=UPI0032670F8C